MKENKCKKEKAYEKLDIYNENRIKTGKIIDTIKLITEYIEITV